MSGVDEMVKKDPSGVLVFIVIGVSRAFQGAFTGIFFVIVQVCDDRENGTRNQKNANLTTGSFRVRTPTINDSSNSKLFYLNLTFSS